MLSSEMVLVAKRPWRCCDRWHRSGLAVSLQSKRQTGPADTRQHVGVGSSACLGAVDEGLSCREEDWAIAVPLARWPTIIHCLLGSVKYLRRPVSH